MQSFDTFRTLLGLAGMLAFLGAAAPASAVSIPFDVQFGGDGTGSFTYENGVGGGAVGFTTLSLDFSPALGTGFEDIGLTGVGEVFFGLGSAQAPRLYDVLTDPGSADAVDLFPPLVDENFVIQFTGAARLGTRLLSTILCSTPAIGPGQYGFCTSTTGGSGGFVLQTSLVPEPMSILLLGAGLGGLLATRRRAGRSDRSSSAAVGKRGLTPFS